MPVFPALGEVEAFKASFSYIVVKASLGYMRLSQQTKQKQKKEK